MSAINRSFRFGNFSRPSAFPLDPLLRPGISFRRKTLPECSVSEELSPVSFAGFLSLRLRKIASEEILFRKVPRTSSVGISLFPLASSNTCSVFGRTFLPKETLSEGKPASERKSFVSLFSLLFYYGQRKNISP